MSDWPKWGGKAHFIRASCFSTSRDCSYLKPFSEAESTLKRVDLPPLTLLCPASLCTPVTLAFGLENRAWRITDLGHVSKPSYPSSMFHTFFSLVALSFLLIIQIKSLSYHSLATVLLMTSWKIIFWWWVILVKTLQVLFSLFSWCFSSTRSHSPDVFLVYTHSGSKWWFYGLLFLVLPVLVHAPEFLK